VQKTTSTIGKQYLVNIKVSLCEKIFASRTRAIRIIVCIEKTRGSVLHGNATHNHQSKHDERICRLSVQKAYKFVIIDSMRTNAPGRTALCGTPGALIENTRRANAGRKVGMPDTTHITVPCSGSCSGGHARMNIADGDPSADQALSAVVTRTIGNLLYEGNHA
jgi:hypothetical protein